MRRLKSVIFVLVMLLNFGLFLGLSANSSSAQGLDFGIRETIILPSQHSENSYVRYVGDLDNDENLDIVYIWYCAGCSEPSTFIIERDGDTFEPRFNQVNVGCSLVAEVDGDNYPEILITQGRYTAKILEATGDNTYALRYTMNFGGKIEPLPRTGDSDGDGKEEFLIPSEWRGVDIYEANGDNSYVLEATLPGTYNGNVNLPGVYDFDGDGLPEVAYSGDPYNPINLTVDVYENRTKVFTDSAIKMRCRSLGDTDGNGRGEIIGLLVNDNLAILESTGSNNQFVEVFNAPRDGYNASNVIDADEDGQSEFWSLIDEGLGQIDVFALAHRDGATISDFYDSGALLQSFSGDIRGLLAIGDTNADGGPELAVVQGDNIHILEQITNQPPSITADQGSVTVDEGQPAANTGSVIDPDQDYVTLTATAGVIINNEDSTWSWSFDATDGPTESQTVTITADDGNGGTALVTFSLAVNNVVPTIDAVAVPVDPVLLGTPVYATADFSDPADDSDELYTCIVNYGDDSGDETGIVNGFTCTGHDHMYAGPGVYTVSVTVTDKDGGSGSGDAIEYIVIYDPTGGFVTGGGWIDSPAGAYTPDPALTGKANFGFVSKYKKGATTPTGETEFQFKVADLNFHSDSYDWLVIAGHKAKYKGTGTINGAGNYGFMLSAIDEKLTPSTDVDMFRIKIWDKNSGDTIVYDNKMGSADDADPGTAIGGGSIVIHKAKK